MTEEEKKKEIKRNLSWDSALRGEPTSFGRPVENNAFKSSLSGGLERAAESEDNVDNGSDGQQGMRSYDDIYDYLDEQIKATQPESEEQRKRRVRTERTQALVNGIADVGRAFANLMATNNYAPNGYEQSQSLSDKARERWEKARAERQKRRAENWNYHLQKAKLKGDERDYELKREKEKNTAAYHNQQMELRERDLELRAQKLLDAKSESEWKHGIEEAKLEIQRERLRVQEDFNNQRISLAQFKEANRRLDNINHNLAEYEETYEYDKISGKVKKKTRTVKNPDGTTTTSEKNVNPKGSLLPVK